MQIEVLALFQKELKDEIASIEKLLPNLGRDRGVKNELHRIFHSMKGASSLLKIEAMRHASAFFEKRVNEEADDDLLKKEIQEYLVHLRKIASAQEDKIIETITANEADFYNLEKKIAGTQSEEETEFVETDSKSLKEIMERFKQHLNYCEAQFDDIERLTLLEELSNDIKRIGKENGIPILQEAGKSLSLCFFAARKKLLGWTRGHFDLITEIVEFLSHLSTLKEFDRQSWIETHKKNIETCIGIIAAVASEATQFMYHDLGEERSTSIILPHVAKTFEPEEKDLQFLGLFLSELKDQIKDFESDLLLIEKEPEDRKIASKLMRASHSLKGAAKAVEFQTITRLAHAMEDIFSLVQKGEGKVIPEVVDFLFKAVDLLTALSKIEASNLAMWLSSHQEAIKNVIRGLTDTYESCAYKPDEKKPESFEGLSTKNESFPIKPPQDDIPSDDKRFLRVSLSHINQLMEIAGEFLVETKTLESFEKGLDKVKIKAGNFAINLEHLLERLTLNAAAKTNAEHLFSLFKDQISDIAHLIEEFNHYALTSETLSTKFYQEMVESRMRPFAEGVEFLPRLIRDLCKQLGKRAKLEIQGKDTLVDREILEKLETPLAHIIRNAIDHGIEPPLERLREGKQDVGTIKIEATHRSGSLVISISDDGKGIDREEVKRVILKKNLSHESIIEKIDDDELLRYLFHPGFSTSKEVTDISGRGMGLSIVLSAVEQLGGKITIVKSESGAVFQMLLPLTLSIIRALIVSIGGEPYAFPLTRIKKVFYIDKKDISWIEGRAYFKEDHINIGLIEIDKFLGLKLEKDERVSLPIVMISDGANDYGIVVESFLTEREIAIHELDKNLGKMEMISAGSFMEDGAPLLIIDVAGLKKCIDRVLSGETLQPRESESGSEKKDVKKVLIVDDSSIVRKVLRFLLTSKGFYCFESGDGEEALKILKLERVDLIITDIDMPKQNGLELIHQIREGGDDVTPIIVLSYKEESSIKEFMDIHKVTRFVSKNRFQDRLFLDVVGEVAR